VIGALLALTLTAAACGSEVSAPAPDTAAAVSTPVATDTAEDAPGATDAPAATDPVADATDATDAPGSFPQRIVSLSPTATEMLFAIGAGDQLVAVDEFSNFPDAALEVPNELSGFEPNVEAIAAFEPDLVLIGGDFNGLVDQLDSIGIVSWDGPAATGLDDVYIQIEQLGALTGHVDEAATLVDDMQARVEQIIAGVGERDEPLTFYHELDSTFYSLDSTTFIGELYTMLGLENVADRAEGENFGYPQLNAESIVSADPDLIFLADTKCCEQSAETVAARDGWAGIAAVRNGNVIEMDDDIASRWGPRVVDYLAAIAAAIEGATPR
jgi:iron complex transport system substrate-binding protein